MRLSYAIPINLLYKQQQKAVQWDLIALQQEKNTSDSPKTLPHLYKQGFLLSSLLSIYYRAQTTPQPGLDPPHQLTISFQLETYGQGDSHCQQELRKILS